MAAALRKSRTRSKPKNKITEKLKQFFLSSHVLPIVLTLFVISISFVLFRMKSVELDYQVSDKNKDIEKINLENKELKARKARMLSTKKLRHLAKKYELNAPKQNQIIVIRQ